MSLDVQNRFEFNLRKGHHAEVAPYGVYGKNGSLKLSGFAECKLESSNIREKGRVISPVKSGQIANKRPLSFLKLFKDED